jgi:hypothetical protein
VASQQVAVNVELERIGKQPKQRPTRIALTNEKIQSPGINWSKKRLGHIHSMAKCSKRERKSVEWEVNRLTASPARFVGTVRAPDEDTAREIAIEQYQIRPQQQRSLQIRRA